MILINGELKNDFPKLDKPKVYNLTSNYISYRRVEHHGKIFEVKKAPKLWGLANRYLRYNPESNRQEEVIYYTREIPIPGDANGRTMHTVDGVPEIYFMEGMIRVHPHQADLAWFLDNAPNNASNENRDIGKPSKFFEVNKDKIEEKRYREGLKMNEAFSHIYGKLSLDQLREICASYGEPNAYELSMMQAQSRLSNWVQRVDSSKGGGADIFLEKLKNPLLPYFLLVRTAIDKRIVVFNNANRMWEWESNGQPIMSVPSGIDEEQRFVNYVYENVAGIKDEIEDMIGRTKEPVFDEGKYSVPLRKEKNDNNGLEAWHRLQKVYKEGVEHHNNGNVEEAIRCLEESLTLNDGKTQKKKEMMRNAHEIITKLSELAE